MGSTGFEAVVADVVALCEAEAPLRTGSTMVEGDIADVSAVGEGGAEGEGRTTPRAEAVGAGIGSGRRDSRDCERD